MYVVLYSEHCQKPFATLVLAFFASRRAAFNRYYRRPRARADSDRSGEGEYTTPNVHYIGPPRGGNSIRFSSVYIFACSSFIF